MRMKAPAYKWLLTNSVIDNGYTKSTQESSNLNFEQNEGTRNLIRLFDTKLYDDHVNHITTNKHTYLKFQFFKSFLRQKC